jgi:hypothetical protein
VRTHPHLFKCDAGAQVSPFGSGSQLITLVCVLLASSICAALRARILRPMLIASPSARHEYRWLTRGCIAANRHPTS